MVHTDEERPLIIDLEDNTDLFTEDSEVVKLWKKVIAELTIEGMNSYKCKVCSFESTHHVQLRAHISNRHFNGPTCPCKICGLQCKNINSLRQHVSRNHRSQKKKNWTTLAAISVRTGSKGDDQRGKK